MVRIAGDVLHDVQELGQLRLKLLEGQSGVRLEQDQAVTSGIEF